MKYNNNETKPVYSFALILNSW